MPVCVGVLELVELVADGPAVLVCFRFAASENPSSLPEPRAERRQAAACS